MKIKLKNRIISALLAFAMVVSVLPVGFVIPVQATNNLGKGTIRQEEDGTWTVIFTGLPTGDGKVGDYGFILVPDISSKGQGNTPSKMAGKNAINDNNGAAVATTWPTTNGIPVLYAETHGSVNGIPGNPNVKVNYDGGTLTFSGIEISKDFNGALLEWAEYTRSDGKKVSDVSSNIPLIALFRGSGGPTFATTTQFVWSDGSLILDPNISATYKKDGSFFTDNTYPKAGHWDEFELDVNAGNAYVYYTLINANKFPVILNEVVVVPREDASQPEGFDAFSEAMIYEIVDGRLGDTAEELASYEIPAGGRRAMRLTLVGDVLLDPGPLGMADVTVSYTDGEGIEQDPATATLFLDSTTSSWLADDITFTLAEGYTNAYKIIPVKFTTDGDATTFVPSNASFTDVRGELTVDGNVPEIKWYTDQDGTDEITESKPATLQGNGSTVIYMKVTLPDGIGNAVTHDPAIGPLVRIAGPAPEIVVGINVEFTSADRYPVTAKVATGQESWGDVSMSYTVTGETQTNLGPADSVSTRTNHSKGLLPAEKATLTATPATGYRFVSWSGGAYTATSDPKVITVTPNEAAETYTATFVANKVTVTVKENANNDRAGKQVRLVNKTTNAVFGTQSTSASNNGVLEFSEVPNATYKVQTSLDGTTWSDVTEVEVANNDKTATVQYYTIAVATNPASGGKAWIGTETTDNGVTSAVVLSGSDVRINASENGGWSFENWTSASGTLTNMSATVNVTSGPRTYTANFTSSSVTIDVLLNGAGDTAGKQVKIVGLSDGTNADTVLTTDSTNKGQFTLTAVPAGTYTIETRQSSSDTWVTASPDASLVVNATGGSATVKYWTVTLGAGSNVLSKWVDTSASSTSGVDSLTVLNGGSAYVYARPATGYVSPADWTITGTHGASDGTSSDNLQLTNITSNITATPSYTKFKGTISIRLDTSANAYDPPSGHSVTLVPTSGSNPTITATRTATGEYTYTGAVHGTTYKVQINNVDTTATRITATNRSTTAYYYTVTAKDGTGATGTKVDGGATAVILGGQTATGTSSNLAGYGSTVTWTSSDSTNSPVTSGGVVTVNSTVTITASYVAEATGVTTKKIELTYGDGRPGTPDLSGTPVTVKVGSATSGFTITITNPGDIPEGLTFTDNKDGTLTLDATSEAKKTTYNASGALTPVTINFTATTPTGNTETGSFTISVAKYNPNIAVTDKGGTHYQGDSTKPAANVTFAAPYWDGTAWHELSATVSGGTNSATTGVDWNFDPPTGGPNTLTTAPTTSATAEVTYTGVTTGRPLTDAWTTVTGTGNITVIATYDLTIEVRRNGNLSNMHDGKTVTVSESDVKGNAWSKTATVSTNKVVIRVPQTTNTGSYEVSLAGTVTTKDAAGNNVTTNVTDKISSGAMTGNKTVAFQYYDVHFADLTAEHGKYPSSAAKYADNLVLSTAISGSTTTRVADLPTITAETNYRLKNWKDDPASGAFNNGNTHASISTTWTINPSYSTVAANGITLTPVIEKYQASVIVNVTLDGKPLPAGNTITLTGQTAKAPTTETVDGKQVSQAVFSNLSAGGYDGGVTDWTGTKRATISGTGANAFQDQTINLDFFTVTAANSTSSTGAKVTAPTNGIVLSGSNVTLTSSPADGYNGPVSWALTYTDGTPSGSTSNNTFPVTKTVTATANYTANKVTLTTKLNGSATGGYNLTLYKGTTATSHTGSTSTTAGGTLGTITFNAVPAGTYNIYDDDGDTGVDVTVTSGSAGNGGTAVIRYYDVKYLAVTSSADHGIYTGITSSAVPDSGTIIINSSIADRRKVDLPGTTADTNYTHDSWTLSPTSGVGSAPAAAASDWTATQSTTYDSAGAITLKPHFGKTSTSIRVVVNLNGRPADDGTVVHLTDKADQTTTGGSTTFVGITRNTNGSAKTYTASASNWTNTGGTGNTASVNSYDTDPYTITLNYFNYHFNANLPVEAVTAGNSASGIPADPTLPVLTGYKVTQPTPNPTLAGYTFKGWATSATGTAATWSNINTITTETTFYAIWDVNEVALNNMTAYAAIGETTIVNFTSQTASATGHSASDFTYSVQTAAQDNVTVAATAGGFTVTTTGPTKKATLVFNVTATSKLNGDSDTATVTVYVEPTYTVVYHENWVTGPNHSGSAPTDSDKYINSNRTGAPNAGFGLANSIMLKGDNGMTVQGFSFGGWALRALDTSGRSSSYTVAEALAVQTSIPADGGEIHLYAVWNNDSELNFSVDPLEATYHMGPLNTESPSWVKNGVDLTAKLTGTTGTCTFASTDLPGFLTFDATGTKLVMKTGRRVDENAGSHTFHVTVTDPTHGDKTATVQLTINKATPIIQGLTVPAGTYYTGDDPLDHMTYTNVIDPYVQDGETGYDKVLTVKTKPKEESEGKWKVDPSAFVTATDKTYTFTYTDNDQTNYNPATDTDDVTAVERTISLEVRDSEAKNPWSAGYQNINSQAFDPTGTWKTITVNIRNPFGNNSPITTLTATPTKGASASGGTITATDAAFRNVTVTSVTPLAVGADADAAGSLILSFDVNMGVTGSGHTLAFKFDGEAGSGGSHKTTSATYTYTLNVGSSQLDTPDPTLTMVQYKDPGPQDAFKDQSNNPVDVEKGGLHLSFPPITQEKENPNPVKEYKVVLTETGSTTPVRSETITADGRTDPYFWYWPIDNGATVNSIDPTKSYTVHVTAISNNTAKYQNSGEGIDDENPGRKRLTIDMITQNLTDMPFNGAAQSSSSKFGAPTGIPASTIQVTYSNKADGTDRAENKTHVNMTDITDPSLTSTQIHDYYIWVYVPQSTYYLALGEEATPVAYNTRTATAATTVKGSTRSTRTSPHENWEIVQAMPKLSVTHSDKQVRVPQTLTPTITYQTGSSDIWNASAGDTKSNITRYYDVTYTVQLGGVAATPSTDGGLTGDYMLTPDAANSSIAVFTPLVDGSFTITATAKYKTSTDNQFRADLAEPTETFTVTTSERNVTSIQLKKWDAVNGIVGGADINPDRTVPDTVVTYGTGVNETTSDDAEGRYIADTATNAKQMRMNGLQLIITYDTGAVDTYVIGADTYDSNGTTLSYNGNLPSGFEWVFGGNAAGTTDKTGTNKAMTFSGAGNATVAVRETRTGGKGSNGVTYTMAKRPIDYTVVSDIERVWTSSGSKVAGRIEFTLPANLTGDNVAIAVNGDQFQTTNQKYADWVAAGSTPYGADDSYTANGNVGKDKLVRAVNAGNSGSGSDVSGTDKAFYKTGKETPGKASITPRLVHTATLNTSGVAAGSPIASATVTFSLNDGEGNRGTVESSPIYHSSGKIVWKVLKEGGDPNSDWEDPNSDWEDPVDSTFLANRVYRPIITVQADTNHYLELSNKYTLNGRYNGQTWTENERTYTTEISVVSDNPYHPDWQPDPDRNVLYNNKGTFIGVIDLTVTPELRFDDVPSDGSGTKGPLTNLVRIVQATTNQSGLGTYDINLGAYVRDVYDVTVSSPSGELLTEKGAVITPAEKQESGQMKTGAETEDNGWLHWKLDLSGVDTSVKGIYTMTISAKGSAKAGTKANDINASYTFALVVDEPRSEPTPMPAESIIVLYWVSLKGKTNDLTGEKIPSAGGRPTFVPKIIGLDGWVFKGWSETDPTLLKDGEKPKLVDPLKISLSADKIYYAYYEKEEVDHVHFVRGYPDGSFRPDDPITRAEVATIIARSCLEGFEEGHDYGNPGGYSDIGTKRWYTSAVSYCSMAGVFTGYPDGTFRPNDYITRQELALVVGRLAGLRVNMGLPFEDASTVNKWARDGVYTCYILGYVDGYKDGTFKPKNNITRAETVKIFNGYLNRGVDAKGLEGMTPFELDASAGSYQVNGTTEYLTWQDVPEKHWAYYEIIEASNDHDFHWPEDENDTSKKDAPPEDWDAVYIEAEWRYRTTYAITWSVTEGMVAETLTKVGLNKTPVAPEVTPDEGRVFLGWALTEDGEVVDLSTIAITGAQTFYGIFADDVTQPKTFTVSFETGEWADLEGESAITVEENGVLTTVPAAIAHEGYIFRGWSLDIGGEVIDPATVVVTEDMTFFAVCEEKPAEPKIFTVTFVTGAQGDLTGETVVTVEEGSFLTELPIATAHEGYEFRGWSLADGGQAVEPTIVTILEDMVFYALYEEQAKPMPEIPDTLYSVKAYIDGYEDGTFRPKEHITRAVVASMIARAYGDDFDESLDYDLSAVSDITPDHWAAKAIGYCLEKGYFSGYPDGTFAPDGTMTRQEFAVVIAKLAGVQENQGLPFTDADSINKWARNYVYTVYVNGWITGYNDGTFKPKNLITRAEAVKIFNAFLGRSTTKASFEYATEFDHVWSDFSAKNWAYPDIMEATNDHIYYINEDGVAIWVDPSMLEALNAGEDQNSQELQSPEETQSPEEGQNPEEVQTPEAG